MIYHILSVTIVTANSLLMQDCMHLLLYLYFYFSAMDMTFLVLFLLFKVLIWVVKKKDF